MADHINTTTIPPQESAAALAQAMADAAAAALGWTADGLSVWQDESKDGLRCLFTVSGTTIKCGGANAAANAPNTQTVTYAANASYCVDCIKTDDIAAVGLRRSDGAVNLSVVFAKNTDGEWRVITIYSATTAYYIKPLYAAAKTIALAMITDPAVGTSFALMPDPFSGCLFCNLYLMVSCPLGGTDMVFSAGGKIFRYIGVGKAGFAAVVG